MLYLVDSSDLVDVSEAIRSSNLISAENLSFPDGFISAINTLIANAGAPLTIHTATKHISSSYNTLTFNNCPTNKTLEFLVVYGNTEFQVYSGTLPSGVNTNLKTSPIVFVMYYKNGATIARNVRASYGSYSGGWYGLANVKSTTVEVTYSSEAGTITLTTSGSSTAPKFRAGSDYNLVAAFS